MTLRATPVFPVLAGPRRRQEFIHAVQASLPACTKKRRAWATSETVFLGLPKKIGVTDAFETTKKACFCTGGTLDQTVGLLVVVRSGVRYKYECVIPSFDAQGSGVGSATCSYTGGILIPLS